MKHEITSFNTKKTLAEALKRSMNTKPFSKITVTEIIERCGVNRKTFYYHFEDIYALLKWTLEQETVEVLRGFDLLVNPEEALAFVLDYVDDNKHILNCVYDSIGREEMKRFFVADFRGVVRSIVDGVARDKQLQVDEEFLRFLSAFYTEALAGMLIDYFQDKEQYTRQEMIDHTLLILKKSIPNVLQAKQKRNT